MRQIRNYCEYDKAGFFSVEGFYAKEIFWVIQTTILPEIPAVPWFRDSISFSNPIPTWPLPPLALPGLLPQPERRAFSKSKENRGQMKSSLFPCFGKLDIQRQHLFSPETVLKLQNHHWQKAFLAHSLFFFTMWVAPGYTIICSETLWNFFPFVSPKYI